MTLDAPEHLRGRRDATAGRGTFAAVVTEPFGDRLNLFGSTLLALWDRDFGPPML